MRIRHGHGYGGKHWFPHICGGLGYQQGGSAIAMVDLVWFGWYVRLWANQIPSYERTVLIPEYRKVAQEMKGCAPDAVDLENANYPL